MNKAILIGRLATDVDYRTTQNGTSASSFRIAVQRRYKNANGTYDADFISVVAWRSTADFISKYFHKGDMIGISGTIQTRSYTAQDGSKRSVTEVIADEAEFVGSKSNGRTAAEQPDGCVEIGDDDGLPF